MKLKPYLLGIVVMLGFISSCNLAYAQESPKPWTLCVYWDARSKSTNYVILTKIGEVKRPLGLGFDLEIDAFAGSDAYANLVGGVSIGKTFPVAQNVDFKLGLGVSTQQGKPTGAGLLIGLTYRF